MKRKTHLKRWENNPNNEYVTGKDENKPRSREIAEKYIYNKNRDKYPKPFGAYVVHHINGKTLNDTPENLYICTKEEHNWIHTEQIKNKKKFQSSKEINIFLVEKRAEGNIKINGFDKDRATENRHIPTSLITNDELGTMSKEDNRKTYFSSVNKSNKEFKETVYKPEHKISMRIIISTAIFVFLLIVILQLLQDYNNFHLNKKEMTLVTRALTYPLNITEREQFLEIEKHVKIICQSHCDGQYVMQSSCGMSGNELEIDCICSDSNSSHINENFYVINPNTGNVLLHKFWGNSS